MRYSEQVFRACRSLVVRALGGAALLLVPVRAAEPWDIFELTLKVDERGLVVAWPVVADLTVTPANPAALEALGAALTLCREQQNADALTDEMLADNQPLPHVRQFASDFVSKFRALLLTRGFTLADGEFEGEPVGEDRMTFPVEFRFEGTMVAAGVDVFEVWVRTNLLPTNAPARRWRMRDLAESAMVRTLMAAQPSDGEGAAGRAELPESFAVVLLAADSEWTPDPAATESAVPEEFVPIFAVGVSLGERARQLRVLDHPRTTTDRELLRQPLEDAIKGWSLRKDVRFGYELHAQSDAAGQRGTPAWVVRLDGFNAVDRQTVRIAAVHLPPGGARDWQKFIADEKKAGTDVTRLERDHAQRGQDLADLLERALPWGEPRFATAAEIAARVALLRAQPDVVAVEPIVENARLDFAVRWHPFVVRWEGTGAYSSGDGGEASTRLSVNIARGSLAIDAFATERRRGVFLEAMTTPRSRGENPQTVSSRGLVADVTRESPARFGLPEQLTLKHRQGRVALRNLWEGGGNRNDTASPLADAAAVSHSRAYRWQAELLGGWRTANLSSPVLQFLNAAESDGWFAGGQLTGEWDKLRKQKDSAPALERSVRIVLAVDASPRQDGVASFGRGELTLQLDQRIGAGRFEDSLFRLSAGAARASSETPLPWWFRLGGDERMRGFDDGELAGRGYAHVGVDIGPSLGAFWSAPTQVPADGRPPIDFRSILILFGAEYAWISDTPVALPAASAVKDGWSFAMSASHASDLPGLPSGGRLTLGYGYAPEASSRRGRFFVSVRIPLRLPATQ